MLIIGAVLTADQIVSQRKDRSIMAYLEIEKVVGREILDSRRNPTVEAEVWLADGTVLRMFPLP